MGKFRVRSTNDTIEIFDGEDIRQVEDYVVFTVWENGRERIARAIADHKIAGWERIDR